MFTVQFVMDNSDSSLSQFTAGTIRVNICRDTGNSQYFVLKNYSRKIVLGCYGRRWWRFPSLSFEFDLPFPMLNKIPHLYFLTDVWYSFLI